MIIETERLILREMKMDDFDSLYQVLSDPENMKYYPFPFDEAKVKLWIERYFLMTQEPTYLNSFRLSFLLCN